MTCEIPEGWDARDLVRDLSIEDREVAIKKMRKYLLTPRATHHVLVRGVMWDHKTCKPRIRYDLLGVTFQSRMECLALYAESIARGAKW